MNSIFTRYLFPLPLLLLSWITAVNASVNKDDTTHRIVISAIRIDGNKITRNSIILREIRVGVNDTVEMQALPDILKKSRENVFNTRLFNFVTIDTVSKEGMPERVDINVHVVERWYYWPWPFIQISDRNFNAWLETMDWSRLTYGVNLTFNNVRGRNETLIIPVHFGFNQQYGFLYKVPYINPKKTLGISFGADYQRNHEVVVKSENNKPVYYKDPSEYPRQITYGFLELLFRPSIYGRHTFHLDYNQDYFTDSLARKPDYSFDSTTNAFHYFGFYYQFRNDHRDIQFYPLKGYYFDVEFFQDGFYGEKINVTYVKSTFRKYWQIFGRWYFASGLYGKVTLTPDPPYFLQLGLGYGNEFIRGYEYYVIDGQHFLYAKNNFKFAIIPQRVLVLDFLKSPKFNTVPYALYLNLFADFGYVHNNCVSCNERNTMQNSFLLGYGVGVDFTSYYDVVVRLEFSLNKYGEPGLYLHFIAPI
jgi:outer membrane protein assembly factor BamA